MIQAPFMADARSTTMFLQDFTILDYAYLDGRQGLRGDSLYVSATLSGKLDHQGFVWDFGQAKKVLKQKVDELLDHRCLVPTEGGHFRIQAEEQYVSLDGAGLDYYGPKEAFCLLPLTEITPPTLAVAMTEILRPFLPPSIESLRVELREEALFVQEASFRYTHGLRYHDGNCQRLFHGHRNPVKVLVEGRRATDLEAELAVFCEGAHFVAKDNLRNFARLDLPFATRVPRHPDRGEISYRSGQGNFSAHVPAKDLIVLQEEPSIENIADMLLKKLRERHPQLPKSVAVHAYEGLNKGAIATD